MEEELNALIEAHSIGSLNDPWNCAGALVLCWGTKPENQNQRQKLRKDLNGKSSLNREVSKRMIHLNLFCTTYQRKVDVDC